MTLSQVTADDTRGSGRRGVLTCLLISLGQVAFGYPASVISVTLGEPSFLIYMKLMNEKGELVPGAEGIIGAINGVFQAGAFFSVLFVSWFSDRYGRKKAFIYCALTSIFGGVLLTSSQNQAMFIVARFFAGAGSWAFLSIKMAPAQKRGFFVGMNGVFLTIGYATATYMGLAFYFVHSSSSWRGPLGIALLWPIIILCALPLIPESPRWLLMQGRSDEAFEVLRKVNQDSSAQREITLRAEFFQISKQVDLDLTLDRTWAGILKRPSNRRRAILTVGFAFVSQSCGPLVINNYGPTFYKALGFNTLGQLALLCGWISVSPPTNLIGAWLVDRYGRRPLMYVGAAGCCVCLAIEAAMIATNNQNAGSNQAVLGVGVAALYVYMVFYSAGIDVGGYVYYSEIWPNHLRSRGLALAVATNALTDLVYLQVTPTAFANIGWRYFLIFIIISGLGAVWVFFTFPETRGLPLEEVATLFGDTGEVAVFSQDIHVEKDHIEVLGKSADTATATYIE